MIVNGVQSSWKESLTVLELIMERGLDPKRVAAERNGTIVPRAMFGQVHLEEDDRIEIVAFVGGG